MSFEMPSFYFISCIINYLTRSLVRSVDEVAIFLLVVEIDPIVPSGDGAFCFADEGMFEATAVEGAA
jgi:hypothetical protein